jgi:NADH dehydrogenase (ubiquinone) 1 alpha subcomplex subunit 9
VLAIIPLLFPSYVFSSFWQIVPMKYNPRDVNSIKASVAKSNVVINLIGMFFLRHITVILKSHSTYVDLISTGREFETRNYGFEEVNHNMAEQLAMVCIV